MLELSRMDQAGKLPAKGAASFFYEHVNGIFNEFKNLTSDEITDYVSKFDQNNDLAGLCSDSDVCFPVRYSELDPNKAELNRMIEAFFSRLYSSGFFDLSFVKKIVGSTIGAYYRSFVSRGNSNDLDVCPFCGILPIDGEYDPTRDAFDHYLPKSKYPFNSVNLKNLCPSCNKCNSGNKRDQDPLRDNDGKPRKAFYPFAECEPEIELRVVVKTNNWRELIDTDLEIRIQSASQPDETLRWQELFGISERYTAKCCSKNGGRYWLTRVFDECQNHKTHP